CGVTTDGTAYCWGSNTHGELGDGTTTQQATPVPVAGNLRFATISAGSAHSCGVTTSGDAYCWGANPDGRLGDGTTTQAPAPVPVAGGFAFTTVRVGDNHSCGVTTSREAYCWGANDLGQLGNGTRTPSPTPAPVATGTPSLTAMRTIPCGRVRSAAGVVAPPQQVQSALRNGGPAEARRRRVGEGIRIATLRVNRFARGFSYA